MTPAQTQHHGANLSPEAAVDDTDPFVPSTLRNNDCPAALSVISTRRVEIAAVRPVGAMRCMSRRFAPLA